MFASDDGIRCWIDEFAFWVIEICVVEAKETFFESRRITENQMRFEETVIIESKRRNKFVSCGLRPNI